MKKFLIRFACFLVLLGLLLALVGTLYAKASPLAQEFQYPVESMPETVDLAVIGSSHALFGIDLSPYSDNYFNFSMAGQTPRYDYLVLREFEDRIADGATVVMSVSYMSPFWTEPEKQFTEKQTRYYRFLSKENILNYDAGEDFRIKLNEVLPWTRIFSTNVSALITALSQPAPSKPAPHAGWYENLKHYQDIIVRDHMEVIAPGFPEGNPRMLEAYENIFAMARKHNWKLVAVTTPFPRPYNDMFDQDFYDAFAAHTKALFSDRGIEYWDYSHDTRFADNWDLFGDLDHLFPEGCRLFSNILAERMGLT